MEVLYALDIGSFLMALDRFLARRVRPVRIVSDNGRNFIGSNAEINELIGLIDVPEVKARHPQIKWEFNTPLCPHSGGVFERMIRSTKIAVRKIVGRAELTDEELHTTFTIVEGLLNSRPLTLVSNDLADLTPLTPAHFLGGEPYMALAPVGMTHNLRTRWHYIQLLMDEIWTRFMKEYTSQLHVFPKWMRSRENPEVGDVVVVLEEKYRGLWPLGRITQVHPTRDGFIRKVEVWVNDRELTRDVQKIVVIVKAQEAENKSIKPGPEASEQSGQ